GSAPVYLNSDGARVLTNTDIKSIVDPIGNETGQLVYADADGNKTFTATGNKKYWANLEGDIIED
ncbi:MAG TPA: hypothetical protein DHW38_05000, partial [Planctomycetaceae bacterium]|nr:hypothetical protein [Planctomycetaceae bacterium]